MSNPISDPGLTVSAEVRQQIRETAKKLSDAKKTPAEDFPGHKGIYTANLEGFLGRFAIPLLDALEAAEAAPENNSGVEKAVEEDALRDLIGRAWEVSTALEGHNVEPELRKRLDDALAAFSEVPR